MDIVRMHPEKAKFVNITPLPRYCESHEVALTKVAGPNPETPNVQLWVVVPVKGTLLTKSFTPLALDEGNGTVTQCALLNIHPDGEIRWAASRYDLLLQATEGVQGDGELQAVKRFASEFNGRVHIIDKNDTLGPAVRG